MMTEELLDAAADFERQARLDPDLVSSDDMLNPEPFTLAKLEEFEADIAGIERAIASLDDGTFGLCEHCGSALDADALVTEPLLTRCELHAALVPVH